MALHTLGTASSSSLTALRIPVAGGTALAAADIGNFNNGIVDDQLIANFYSTNAQASQFTATWSNTGTALSSITNVSGPALGSYMNGYFVLGAGIPPGSTLSAVSTSANTATFSQAATAAGTGANILVVPRVVNGSFMNLTLTIPNRGVLKLFPGDYIAFDPISGWPIVLSSQAVQIAGSLWTFT